MDRLERALRQWSDSHPTRNPPASAGKIRDLSRMLGVEVPEDVAAFYGAADGVPDFNYDRHHVSFWSIDRIAREKQTWPGERGLGFADFLINSWCFELYLDGDELRVWVSGSQEGAGSFTDFLETYVQRPDTFPIL